MSMFTKYIVLWLVLLMMPVASYAIDDKLDPIDKRLEECIKKDSTTAGMNNCSNAAYKEWDILLNNVYKKLINKLNKDAKTALKSSQREWIKYRDVEFKFIIAYYDGFQGSMYSNMSHGDHVSFMRERALKLKSYLELIDME